MMTTTTQQGTLAALRALVPQRPLRYSEALVIAELQANRFLELAGIDDAPVPSEIITELPRVAVEVRSLPALGSAHWVDGRWVIHLAVSDHPRRRRFTLAHEFKHILDHPYQPFLYQGFHVSQRAEQIEHIADTFAASLLMPKRLVREAFTIGIQNPYELARLFEVSPAAMQVRLHRLGLPASRAGFRTTRQWTSTVARLSEHKEHAHDPSA
jgi:IrrE N-terminal-like domain